MAGLRVVTAVGEKPVGRIADVAGDYYIVRRPFRRARYPLPKRYAVLDRDERHVLMRLPRQVLFAAPKVTRGGELDPATDEYYSR